MSSQKPLCDAPRVDHKKKKTRGFVELRAHFNTKKSMLVLELKQARSLAKPINGYCKVFIPPNKGETKQRSDPEKEKSDKPIIKQALHWLIDDVPEYRDKLLHVEMWDKSALRGFVGSFSLPISDILPPNIAVEGWFELLDSKRGASKFKKVEVNEDAFSALYDNDPRGPGELFMRKGDLVYTLKDEGAWTLVENAITGERGYVPSQFVVKANSLESEPWFFGAITRAKADKLLLNPMRKHGSFLIRESESKPGTYSLSMKDGDDVRHFRIKSVEGTKFRIQGSPSQPHDDLKALVAFHKKSRCGLSTRLKKPCPREVPAKASDLGYAVRDEWEVPRDSVELKKLLGQGQYGEVYSGTWNKVTPVAVKTLKEDRTSPQEFLEEAQLMKKLKHDNLVRLYAVCTIGQPIYIITELLSNGSMLDYLHTPAGEELRLPTLIGMATDIANGMSYLEANNYVHRDLAARNVLVGDNNVCKVADFGLARVIDLESNQFTPETLEKFPVRWTAPEAMNKNIYSVKSDVWSFGILMAELITYGRKPYYGMKNQEVVDLLKKGGRMDIPKGCPESLYKIMLDCWKEDPKERPTFEGLGFKLEEFFQGDSQYQDANKLLGEEEGDYENREDMEGVDDDDDDDQ
eukprot:m.45799 g.45799  ORF g.45799 m.45799 type:complete len:633 (+) comp10695_c0_seq1:134-2032(+)